MDAVSEELPPIAAETGEEAWKRLFRELAAGSMRAMESLYDAASGKLFGLALWRTGSREDACDVVQEVFVRLAEQRARLAKVKNPKAWLLTVAHRAAVDVTRRRKRRRTEPMEACRYLEAPAGDADRAVEAARAAALLDELPPAQREAVYLRHFAGCTFSEIGKVTGVPAFTAASRYRLGISKLRDRMEGKR